MLNPLRLAFSSAFTLLITNAFAQGGTVFSAPTTPAVNALLNPNLDNFITLSGAAFTSTITEAVEFEKPAGAIGKWTEIFDVNEANSDITPSCGPTDIATDGNGGDVGYWIMADPTPGSPRSGDEHLVLRMRTADRGTGNFGYNFLLSTDGLYGAGVDPNAVTGNQGFEYEVQFASGGGKSGVSGWNLDGLSAQGAINCNQCITVGNVQKSNAAIAGTCTAGSPTFITFALPLANLPAGLLSNVSPAKLFIGMATAASGNQSSIVSGGNVKDYGAFNDDAFPAACVGLAVPQQFDCLMQNNYQVQQAALPVTLVSLSAKRSANGAVDIQWQTAAEVALAGYEIQRATDPTRFTAVHFVAARRNDADGIGAYSYIDAAAPASTTTYYRLRSLDHDGAEAISGIVAVEPVIAEPHKLVVAPNPATQYFQVSTTAADVDAEAVLVDALGRIVRRVHIAAGASVIRIECEDLPKGLYTIGIAATDRAVRVVLY